jgi:transcriptional regulator with XRE-family HTH domain
MKDNHVQAQQERTSFARGLRSLMRRHNLTGSALAKNAGLSKSAVSNYLLGKATPTHATRKAIASAFGVPPKKLAFPADDRPSFEVNIAKGNKPYVRLEGHLPTEVIQELQRILVPYL